MVGVLSVGKSKKDVAGDSLEAIVAIQLPADEPPKPQVKLRPEFKAALQRVALHAGQDMGELIEKYMTRFITREDRRIAMLRLGGSEEGE